MDTQDQNISKQEIDVSNPAETLSTRFENRSKTVTEELSLKEIAKIFTGNWLLFLIIFTATAMSSVGIYVFRTPFVATGLVVVNDSQNSSLQSFANQFYGLNKSLADGKKNNSPLQKHLEFLKTEEFFKQLLTDIQKSETSDQLTMAEKRGLKSFKAAYLKSKMTSDEINTVVQKLDSMAKIKLSSEFEIKVSFLAPEKEVALFITNVALQTIASSLRDREMLDTIKVETFIKAQLEATTMTMTSLNQELANFQSKPENLISLSSKEKVGEYLSELMVRKNEIRMKIAENEKTVKVLSGGKPARRESQLYGSGGRIQAITLENEMLRSKLVDIQKAVDQVTYQAKSIPVATQVFEELKKKSEMEFKKFKELSDANSKIEVQKLSAQSRFEILEKSRIEKVLPQVSLLVLLMLSLVISQVLGSLVIYVMYIWDSNAVTTHASRDIVIIDSHSLDPRVIIENTKIKFRLRNSSFLDSGDSDESASKRLTFKVFDKKDSGDSVENG